ncbi:MAG TPA: TolC family protein, partial [Saprospiraceae bacterium]|nr:TolC family protein [Saprospiraceae bacterium]HPI05353.1 TolC family protein [Saprospiraceae bacterium]
MLRLFTLLCIFSTLQAAAQQTDFDLIVQPVDTKARDFSEYLVQLAWMNGPDGIIAIEEVKNAESAIKNTKKEWMRDIQATFNLNEANVRAPDTSSNVFFPRYNLGLNLNLYNILSQKEKNQIGKRDIEIAEQKVNKRKLEIRAETLSRYANYKLAHEILKARTLVEQDMNSTYILVQQLYKNDEKTLEDYTTASAAYFAASEARIRAETDVLIAKYRVEEMIGLKWEQVQHPAKEF